MGIKAGIDVENEKVYIETSSNSLSHTTGMDPIAARLLASQLRTAADQLDEYKRETNKLAREKSDNGN